MANNFTITISAVDKATDVARKVNKSLARITDPINKLGKETKALGDHFRVIGKMTGVSQIAKGFNKVSGAAIGAARSVASVVTPIAALTGAGTVAGIIALATAFGRTATSVKNTAGVLGMPTQQLQAYTGAARLVGLSSEDMSAGLKSLGNAFEDSVTGRNLEAAGAMNQFGISVHRLKNGSIDTTRALSDIANVIQKMPNAQAQQKFASIFGVEQLLPMLQKGGEGIDKLVGKAKSIGAVMTPEQIAAGERYNEQMVALDLQAEKLKVTFGNALAPAVERVVGVVGRLVDKYGAVVGTKIAEYAERIANWIDRTDWAKVANDVGSFLDKIGGLQTVAIALAAITFATPIAGILSMVTGLVRLATFAVPLAIAAFGKLGRAKVASEAAGAAEDAASAAGKAGAGEAAKTAGKGILGRVVPWAVRLGLPLWLMTHSEGLNTGEDAFLAQHRAAPGSAWQGDAVGEQRREGAAKDPKSIDAVNAFQKMGWTRAQASGIAANLWKESLFNPSAVGDNGRAYGIAQWHEDRQSEFKKLFGIDIRKSTLAQQMQFVDYELRHGKEQRAGSMLAATKTAAEAGSIVAKFYERPAQADVESA
ncbi:TPA: phage tail tip lysozyme, partial [Burkholderia contaminans]